MVIPNRKMITLRLETGGTHSLERTSPGPSVSVSGVLITVSATRLSHAITSIEKWKPLQTSDLSVHLLDI